MNQVKFYKLAIGGLLLLNLAVLAFFIITKPKPHRGGPPHLQVPSQHGFESEAITILDLDKKQISKFKNLANNHAHKMTSITENQQKLLLPYFESISDRVIEVENDKTLNLIQQLELEKIQATRQHLLDVKNLLNKDQQPRFNKFAEKIIDKILKQGKKKPIPPKDFE